MNSPRGPENAEMITAEPTKSYRIPRYRVCLVREGSDKSDFRRFVNSREAAAFARNLFRYGDREEMWVLLLDAKNSLIGTSLVSVGSLSTSIVHPREAMKPAVATAHDKHWRDVVRHSVAALIYLHNHPSGDPTPSAEDRECTKRLCEAGKILGIRVLDHIITGDADYFSFADAGFGWLSMDDQDLNNQAASGAGGSGSDAANDVSEPEAQRPQGTLLVFKRRSLNEEAAIYRLLLHNEPSCGITERKVAKLVSKHAYSDWRLRVGDRVAGRSGDRIVLGTVLGTKSDPRRPAAFYRDTFTACWLLLDSGERALANELRPVS